MDPPRVIAVMGVTASGKSAVAEALASMLDARIVSADAFQVYRGFDIGTAKPDDRSLYELIDILDPEETYSAGRFVQDACTLIDRFEAEGRDTIVCGGTGLYVRALIDNYEEMSAPDHALREQLKREIEQEGLEAVLKREQVAADELSHDERKNPVRVLRFLEKRRMPSMPRRKMTRLPAAIKFVLEVERDESARRIESRVDQMVNRGWMEEVHTLLGRGVSLEAPAFRAIGYREMAEAVLGGTTVVEAIEKTKTATRQYAKKQRTWLRKEPSARYLPSGDARTIAHEILKLTRGGSNHG